MSTRGFESDEIGFFVRKAPASLIDVGWDWTDYLDGASISASAWTVAPSGNLTANDDAIGSGVLCTVRLGAGALGAEYWVTNRVTTSQGVIDETSFRVKVVKD